MAKNEKELTPLMQQYWHVKSAHPDKVVLFRMGDFFEMFHDDAITAAPLLNITLTQRNKKSNDSTPMCGVPHHSIGEKINRLLSHGLKVAICDQIEDPKQAKGLVKRAVTRILSPGMVYDPETLSLDKPHYLCAFDEKTMALLDSTSGEAFFLKIENQEQLQHLAEVLKPVEWVLPLEQAEIFDTLKLEGVKTIFQGPEDGERLPLTPAERLKAYAQEMQGSAILHILQEFEERPYVRRLQLTAQTLRHLEIFETYKGEKDATLFAVLNSCKTAAGSRLLRHWLSFPLRDVGAIQERQNKIAGWLKNQIDLKEIRKKLAELGDIERRLGKIAHPTCSPFDLKSLSDSLAVGLEVSSLAQIQTHLSERQVALEFFQEMDSFFSEAAPLQFRQGGFVRKGYSKDLDHWIELSENAQGLVQELEQRERDLTGIGSLKVRYNNVFGFYIEVTHSHKDKIPEGRYLRKQTLANAERFTTEELQNLEREVAVAKGRRQEIELDLFERLKNKVLQQALSYLELAKIWAELDVVTSQAWSSLEKNYVCPEFDLKGGLEIQGSRHPVVESLGQRSFIANDIRLQRHETMVLTGPNMAGKSTLMRQVALTCLMAQAGLFVAAQGAKLPVLDQIFTRIGASDFIAEGLSTFMVEMKETAEILAKSTPQSLIIMDEIGRGTATFDGLSLAQAILEFILREKPSLTFFATHYHELVSLEVDFHNLKNYHLRILEEKGGIQFLYQLKKGAAGRSYGIQVARLAGLPSTITLRAEGLLKRFESVAHGAERVQETPQLSLFSEAEEKVEEQSLSSSESKIHPLVEELKSMDLNQLTPLEALNQLALWRGTLERKL